MSDKPLGFVALQSLKKGPADPAQVLADLRKIYFRTTKKTIEHDLAHAIELLKSLPDEDDRDRARVYMDGLSQMRSEWAGRQDAGRLDRRASKTPRPPAKRR